MYTLKKRTKVSIKILLYLLVTVINCPMMALNAWPRHFTHLPFSYRNNCLTVRKSSLTKWPKLKRCLLTFWDAFNWIWGTADKNQEWHPHSILLHRKADILIMEMSGVMELEVKSLIHESGLTVDTKLDLCPLYSTCYCFCYWSVNFSHQNYLVRCISEWQGIVWQTWDLFSR